MRISVNWSFARIGPYPALRGDILLEAQTQRRAVLLPSSARLPAKAVHIYPRSTLVTLASPQWTLGPGLLKLSAGRWTPGCRGSTQLRLGGHGQVKAAAFYEYGPAEAMQYADIPDPVLGPGDVLVQVQACGVNHSDLDAGAGTSRWPFELPMVLGAEFTGTVVGVGNPAGPIRTGDLVTALQQYSCGRCAQCAKWRPDRCAAFEIFGTTRWGGYGELVCVPAEVVVPLDPADDPIAVAAGQCVVSTAWHMVNRLALVRPGDLVLVPSASGGVAGALGPCAEAGRGPLG